MTFSEAARILETCTRDELVDRAFGDREITFTDASGIIVACGYVGWVENSNIVFYDLETRVHLAEFKGADAIHLCRMGRLGMRHRNDSQVFDMK